MFIERLTVCKYLHTWGLSAICQSCNRYEFIPQHIYPVENLQYITSQPSLDEFV